MEDYVRDKTGVKSTINILGLHQLEKNGNKVVYLELLPLLENQNPEICRMNSSDYLGLNGNPLINKATLKAIDQFGTGRNGNIPFGGETILHSELQEELKDLYKAEDCMITPNGTISNFNVMYSLVAMGDCDAFFSDEKNHATLISGMQLAQVKNKSLAIYKYNHLDYDQLETQLIEYRSKNSVNPIVIVTDGIFSMEGTIANAKRLLALAETYDALVVFDECHSIGVIGDTGGGTLDHNQVDWNRRVIITGTFGKAIPCNGGYIVASKLLIQSAFKYGRFATFCGTMTPPDCATAITALKIIKSLKVERDRLHKLVRIWRKSIYDIYIKYNSSKDKYALFYSEHIDSPSPIIPFFFNLNDSLVENSHVILPNFAFDLITNHRLYTVPVTYPAVTKGAELIRVLITLETNEKELKYWAKCLEEEYAKLVHSDKTIKSKL